VVKQDGWRGPSAALFLAVIDVISQKSDCLRILGLRSLIADAD
jgi:hypothetical protein